MKILPTVEELVKDVNKLKISHQPKFIVNPIIYVDGVEADESSDEEYDSSDEEIFDDLADTINRNNLPYRTFKITKSNAEKTKGQDKFSKPVGFLPSRDADIEVEDLDAEASASTVAQSFLNNLYSSGLDLTSGEKIEEVVAVSMLLNRPLSISTRKNNLLLNELESVTESPIAHAKFGVFWKFQWYGNNNETVTYDTVRTFYKKLKSYDKDNGTTKAEQFKNIAERGVAVPYQELREQAKNHENTKAIIRSTREDNPECDVYMSFVDGDTKSFNGIYSAYIRIYQKSKITPTIMSTGYEFTEERIGDYPIVEGGRLDRQIRVATAKYLSWSIYYPEPNFCVFIMPEHGFLHESFIDKSIKCDGVIIKNAESVALIRHILNSRDKINLVAIFADDKPLLTTIPPRVRLTKGTKSPIKFSEEFRAGLGPDDKDFTLFKQMSQSHVHEGVWIDNLYINRSISVKIGKHFHFKSLITKYLKAEHTRAELEELLTIISNSTLQLIKRAYDAKEEIVKKYKSDNLRTHDMKELLDYIKLTLKQEISDFETEFLKIIASANVLQLLQDEILDLNTLCEVPDDTLRDLLYNDEVIKLLENEERSFEEILEIYSDYFKDTDENFDDVSLSEFIELIESKREEFGALFFEAEMSILEIMNLYEHDYKVFIALASDDAINFIKEYTEEIDIDEIIRIYKDNKELFQCMITDPNGIIADIGIRDFIDKFEESQTEIEEIPFDDPYYGAYDPYDNLCGKVIEDGCPDELLCLGSDSEYSDEDY